MAIHKTHSNGWRDSFKSTPRASVLRKLALRRSLKSGKPMETRDELFNAISVDNNMDNYLKGLIK